MNSGLVFVCTRLTISATVKRLNPFEFRAGICLTAISGFEVVTRLNPFEFRAGICFQWPDVYALMAGLNPFEFRAGICFVVNSLLGDHNVLIPLNSGLVFVSESMALLVLIASS